MTKAWTRVRECVALLHPVQRGRRGICSWLRARRIGWAIAGLLGFVAAGLPVSLDAQPSGLNSARPAAGATSPTTTTASPGPNLGDRINLGALGGEWAYITLGKLRGQIPTYGFRFDKQGELATLNMEGLIRIQTEAIDLECESLSFTAGDRLEARYNVHVNLKNDGIEAQCGQLVYNLKNNTIVLTVNPKVTQASREGVFETYNISSMTITLNPDGSLEDVQVSGTDRELTVLSLNPQAAEGGVRGVDQPTSPAKPMEIQLEGDQRRTGAPVAPSPTPAGGR